MRQSFENSTLALAGIFQASALVKQIANRGIIDAAPFEVCIKSLFDLNPSDMDSVYGDTQGLTTGLQILVDQFGIKSKARDIELTRYAFIIIHLQKKLLKKPELLNKLTAGIEKAQGQTEFFSSTHENVIASLAHTYTETISTLTPRIIVNGESVHLTNNSNANRIRALLLAAIRSAVLWQQCGGKKLQLLFKRKDIARMAQSLLKSSH